MFKLGTVVAMATICAIAGQAAHAQRKAPPRKAAAAPRKAAVAKPSPTAILARQLIGNSLEPGSTQVYETCRGSNYAGLLWAMEDVLTDWDSPKGEFETTADYEKRRSGQAEVVNGGRDVVVCIPLAEQTTSIRYDVDNGVFTVGGSALRIISSTTKDLGSYRSSTAMGAKATVYADLVISYELDAGIQRYSRERQLGCEMPFGDIKFAVPKSDAMILRASGYVAVRGQLKPPFITKREESGKPTLSDPWDTQTVTLTGHVDAKSVTMVGPAGLSYSCT